MQTNITLRSSALTLALALVGCSSSDNATAPAPPPPPAAKSEIHHPSQQKGIVVDQWGIEILGLRPTAAGQFLDFRYRVLDPAKAQPLADGKKPAFVVDPKSSEKHEVTETPTAGQLRERGRPLKKDRIYTIIFGNPGGRIAPGERVTVAVGDFFIDNILVE